MSNSTFRRFFRIAEVTIQVDSELPMDEATFHPKFRSFEVNGPGEDTIRLEHRFHLPPNPIDGMGKVVYDRAPWRIHRDEGGWTYLGIVEREGNASVYVVARFSPDHSHGVIYHDGDYMFRLGNAHSLTFFPTDQIILGRVMAQRDAFYIHASGVSLNGRGFLFVGASSAGKSTTTGLLGDSSITLCDDRMIVRQAVEGFRIHGTWSHGDIPDVSAASAPLTALFFLHKAEKNRLVSLSDPRESIHRILDCLVRPVVDAEWWDRMFSLMERVAARVPCFILEFCPHPGLGRFLQESGF